MDGLRVSKTKDAPYNVIAFFLYTAEEEDVFRLISFHVLRVFLHKGRRKGQRMGTLIQPLAKATAKMTNGVDIPKMIM